MSVPRHVRRIYTEMLFKSLIHEADAWIQSYQAAADWSWVDYHSPDYRKVSFVVSTIGGGAKSIVYVKDVGSFTVRTILFSRMWIARRRMQKLVSKRTKELVSKRLMEAIVESKHG